MRYDMLNELYVEAQQKLLAKEMVQARRCESISTTLKIDAADMLAALLDDLAEIAMNAPGGHGYWIDEAGHWASILRGKR